MLSQPLPDLARSLQTQSQVSQLRLQLDMAGEELTTGIVADMRAATRGNLAPVFAIDAAMADLDVRGDGLALAMARADVAQAALERMGLASGDLALSMLDAQGRGDVIGIDRLIPEAEVALGDVVSALNTRFGGRALFAGAAEDGRALGPVEDLLADVRAIVAAAPDAATAVADIDTYFAPGGGFDAYYQGSDIDAAGAPLDPDRRLSYLPKANDESLRETMKGLAMMATANDGFTGDLAERDAFLNAAASGLQSADRQAVALRAALGAAQEEIALASDAVEAERSTLSIARNDLVGVDQFEAAAQFTALEAQLQSLFTVTARLSSLNLTNFLR